MNDKEWLCCLSAKVKNVLLDRLDSEDSATRKYALEIIEDWLEAFARDNNVKLPIACAPMPGEVLVANLHGLPLYRSDFDQDLPTDIRQTWGDRVLAGKPVRSPVIALGFKKVNKVSEIHCGREYVVGTISSGDDWYSWSLTECYRNGVLKYNTKDGNLTPGSLTSQQMEDDLDAEYIKDDDDCVSREVFELPRWVPGSNDAYRDLVYRSESEARRAELL